MKNTFPKTILLCLVIALTSCDGVVNISSQSSTNAETNISENSQTITNGDTTINKRSKKEKTHSESENRTNIGFSVEDKTGIADEVHKNLKKERSKDNPTDENDASTTQPESKTLLKSSIACDASISGDEFENAKARFEKIHMDVNRVRKGKEIFNELCITSKQAQELISVLKLENYKLDLAKFLYGRTTNKEKFMCVAEEFTFGETKKKLANYIKD